MMWLFICAGTGWAEIPHPPGYFPHINGKRKAKNEQRTARLECHKSDREGQSTHEKENWWWCVREMRVVNVRSSAFDLLP